MPLPLIILGAALVAFVLLMPQTALGYFNGVATQIQVSSIGGGCVLQKDAAASFLQMQSDASAGDGVDLHPKGPNSAFRTHDVQAEMIEERPAFAAALDHSPHQEGIAVDFDLTSPNVLPWLQQYGPNYGWNPLPGAGATKEPWHWEFSSETT